MQEDLRSEARRRTYAEGEQRTSMGSDRFPLDMRYLFQEGVDMFVVKALGTLIAVHPDDTQEFIRAGTLAGIPSVGGKSGAGVAQWSQQVR